ncbi:MAG TPA: hypothetical protein VFP72_18770 [Kineosporiaceae bacterium]|nr:hypothetical protein [Kineosporiaceae bacterium]
MRGGMDLLGYRPKTDKIDARLRLGLRAALESRRAQHAHGGCYQGE